MLPERTDPARMRSRERSGVLLIADLGRYTEYLEHTALTHAQAIVSQLLEAILTAAPASFELAKLEGDAIFFVIDEAGITSRLLREAIERMFLAFHAQLSAIAAATHCGCQGCLSACTLRVKFVCHHGRFAEHTVRDRCELIGRDVIVVHRLLKNSVPYGEYAAFTSSVLERWGEDLPSSLRLTETYEHVGDVEIAVWDLGGLCAHFH